MHDDSKDKDIGGRNFYRENWQIISEFQKKGLKVLYIGGEDKEKKIEAIIDYLFEAYSQRLLKGELDLSIQAQVIRDGSINRDKIANAVRAAFATDITGVAHLIMPGVGGYLWFRR